jgi:hypothetical protein
LKQVTLSEYDVLKSTNIKALPTMIQTGQWTANKVYKINGLLYVLNLVHLVLHLYWNNFLGPLPSKQKPAFTILLTEFNLIILIFESYAPFFP